MSKSKTVQTAYGETSIEVVECDSCGNEMSKDDARVFIVADGLDNEWSDIGKIGIDGDYKTGYICDYCDDAGPMSLPGSDSTNRVLETLKPLWYDYELDGIHPFKAMAWFGLLIFAGVFVLEVMAFIV